MRAPHEFRDAARRRLPRFLFDYVDGAAMGEETMRRNAAALQEILLEPRLLVDAERMDTSSSLLGRSCSLPVALGPVGLAGLLARRGEVQAARAAAHAGVPFCLSTVSACSLGEVRKGAGPGFWFQLYMIRDRGFLKDLLAQARDAGCETLVFTADMPTPGVRYRDRRSGLSERSTAWAGARRLGQALTRPAWALDVGLLGRPHTLGNVAPVLRGRTGLEDFMAWMAGNFDASVTWRELEAIRAEWPGTLVLKGVMRPEDARQATAAGADAVVVSNHGGRQLDGAPATAEVLPTIRDSVPADVPVLVDGGVRNGLDLFRMLALGADGVLLGRAWAFALAANGERGVRRLLELLTAELRTTMCLTGCATIANIGTSSLSHLKERT